MNTKKSTILKPVFYPSVIFIGILVLFTVIDPKEAGIFFSDIKNWIASTFGWFYMFSVGIFMMFIILLAVSNYGRFRLGPDQSRPEFGNFSWFAMLFSAGMGIGLMFFGVAEPIMHFNAPLTGESGTEEAAKEAMKLTFLHWGFHAWAIYAVVGLVLAYFSFRHRLPLSIRSALYPLIGDKIYGPIGHAVDTVAVLGTLFGVATSLGFGVTQINSGFHYLFDMPISVNIQIGLIVIITAAATISVVTGLDAGIKRISQLNLVLAIFLLGFILLVGPFVYIMQALIENMGNYLSSFVELTFKDYAYGDDSWFKDWTVFYWAWWIAWAPFVGMFIARVSKGRTIREFILGVMFVPVGFSFIWMTAFGNTGLEAIMQDGYTALSDAVANDSSTALFSLLEHLPFSGLTSFVAVILVITFFVTSSDSASLVIDTLSSTDKFHHPVWQRIFWASSEGLVAIILLLAGGLGALQSASIAIALPFTVIMLIACFGLWQGLRIETVRYDSLQHHMNAARHSETLGSWQNRITRMLEFPSKKEVIVYVNTEVVGAMKTLQKELEAKGWTTELNSNKQKGTAIIIAHHEGAMDFIYEVRTHTYDVPNFAFPEVGPSDTMEKYAKAEVFLQDGSKAYDIYGYEEKTLIDDMVDQFEKHHYFLHHSSRLKPVLPFD